MSGYAVPTGADPLQVPTESVAALHRGQPLGRSRWQGPPADIPLYLIMAANIALLVAAIGVAGWHVTPVRINPMLGPPQEYLSRLGAVDAGRVAREHQFWRVLVSPFLNAGADLDPQLK